MQLSKPAGKTSPEKMINQEFAITPPELPITLAKQTPSKGNLQPLPSCPFSINRSHSQTLQTDLESLYHPFLKGMLINIFSCFLLPVSLIGIWGLPLLGALEAGFSPQNSTNILKSLT